MKMIIIALFDLKSREYQPPMYVNSIPVAMRDLGDQLTDPNNKNPAARHPQDFELHQLAEFDTLKGQYDNTTDPDDEHLSYKPKYLYSLVDLMPKKQ